MTEWQVVQKSPKKPPKKGQVIYGTTDKNLSKTKVAKLQLREEFEESTVSTVMVMSKIEHSIRCLQQSSLFVSTCAAIDSTTTEKFKSVICLGIGNFSTSANCLLQLSLYISLRTKYLDNNESNDQNDSNDNSKKIRAQSFLYDPMLTEIEKSICLQFGISVCEENLHGQYLVSSCDEAVDEKVLFFLPHCPYQLYCNLLWTNVAELHRIYILGNRYTHSPLVDCYYMYCMYVCMNECMHVPKL